MDREGFCVERLPSQPMFGRKSDYRYTPYFKRLKSHYPKQKFLMRFESHIILQ